MLELTDTNVYFNRGTADEVHAIRNLSVTIADEQMVMVVGSNGAGKSTLTNLVAGNVTPSSGSIRMDGKDVTRLPSHKRARWLSRVFPDPLAGTVGDMSIRDNFVMAMSRNSRRTLRGTSGRRLTEIVHDSLATLGLGLEDRLNEDVGKLSSGQRQAVTLAMACYGEPSVLILDEHLAALDPMTRERLKVLTVAAARRAGCITLMITHSMSEAATLGDRVLVMHEGSVLADIAGREKDELTADSLVARLTASGVELSDRALLERPAGDAPDTRRS